MCCCMIGFCVFVSVCAFVLKCVFCVNKGCDVIGVVSACVVVIVRFIVNGLNRFAVCL